ncbi:MAG: AAA family ATPase [Acidobacteriales bacterium]|nr:AAA family ATPase [Terriglobales bacterium]
MQFVIANTFQESLGKLQRQEQTAAKLAAMELQMNPAHPSLKMHRLDKVKDKNFWSARANDDVRLIVHRTENSCLLCYVDHHDAAYAWAESRKLAVHPTTGAAQLVVLKETIQEVVVRKYVEDTRAAQPLPLLSSASEAELLGYGVPEEWLMPIRQATEDTILDLAGNLPEEAREAVLSLATGVRPVKAAVEAPNTVAVSPAKAEEASFAHPDAQRRFRTVANRDELERALNAPWERWAVFLHPAQRVLVERDFNGPARVTGPAGTGKTVVALHRAVHLAESHPSSRVLLTTFSDVLANSLENKLRLLIGNRPRLGEQIEVLPIAAMARRLYNSNLSPIHGPVTLASYDTIRTLLKDAAEAEGITTFSLGFLCAEWEQIVDAWQTKTWTGYRDVPRLGRRTRLREPQREALWRIFARVIEALSTTRQMTEAEMFTRVATHYAVGGARPFDFAVVDEAQDISQAELRCLAALGGGRPNALFFAGDTGQRIFQQPFSWKSVGVDVRGRSTNLKVNYRTSHQIRECADRLLDREVADPDGNVEDRRGTVSVFNGPAPDLQSAPDSHSEQMKVAQWLRARSSEGVRAEEMVIFVRSAAQLDRAEAAAKLAELRCKRLEARMEVVPGVLPISTMHLAKGLEFRAVVVMACDAGALPDVERIESASDPAELEEIYNSERQLLYVACTRARDRLLITSASEGSEFLQDFRQ